MLNPNKYENKTLDWLSKHAMEMVFSLIVAFMIWEANLLLDLSNRMTVIETDVSHINGAVNNVGENEKTLRELVVETRQDIAVMKSHNN